MTLRYSTAARNFMADRGSYKDAFQNGKIIIYTGAQPASADAAATGTILAVITDASGAHTPEVSATGTVTLTAGASGSVNTITLNGVNILGAAIPFNVSLTQTAIDCVTQINAYRQSNDYVASSVGAIITITATPGMGTIPNGLVLATTTTTITTAVTPMAGGVAPANGLKFGNAVAGVLSKLASQTWSGVNLATGTAGWYRQYGSVADTGVLDSTATFIREDGVVSTAGSEMVLSSTALTVAATTTISSDTLTIPTL